MAFAYAYLPNPFLEINPPAPRRKRTRKAPRKAKRRSKRT